MRKRTPQTLLVLAGTILLVLWQLYEGFKTHILFGDFRAFYCGGSAVLHGANPYIASAIYGCESAPMPWHLYAAAHAIAVPAPLPGYALLAFAPFAMLPYLAACIVWLLVLLACLAFAVRALSLLVDCSLAGAACALVPGIAVVVIPYGELGCVVLAALSGMALAVRARAWSWAAVAASVAMILPHVALPALVAALIFLPAMRGRIVVAGVVLAVLDLAGSHGAALAYLFSVLPAHARAEIPSSVQYGMTWMLHAAHASDAAALAGGSASYAVAAILGIAASARTFAQLRDRACYALVPPAFAVFGGTFVHYAHIMTAIPAAFLLAKHVQTPRRELFAAAALLLIVPWLWVLSQPLLLPVFALACGMCTVCVLDLRLQYALRIALAAVVVCGVVLNAGAHFGAGTLSIVHGATAHKPLAQAGWTQFIARTYAVNGPAWWIAKLPTWIGLLLLSAGVLLKPAKTAPQSAPAIATPR